MGFKRTITGIGIGIGAIGAGLFATGMLVGSTATLFLTPKDGPTMRRLTGEKMRAIGGSSVAAGKSLVATGREAGRKVVSLTRRGA